MNNPPKHVNIIQQLISMHTCHHPLSNVILQHRIKDRPSFFKNFTYWQLTSEDTIRFTDVLFFSFFLFVLLFCFVALFFFFFLNEHTSQELREGVTEQTIWYFDDIKNFKTCREGNLHDKA